MIVHTNFLAPAILASQKSMLPQAVIITDYKAHNFWLQKGVNLYFVASPDMKAHLEANAVEASRIKVTGIPVSPQFIQPTNKLSARAELGISETAPTVLFLASGLKKAVFVELLEQLANLDLPLDVLLVCGRSKDLLNTAHSLLAKDYGSMRFQVHGYVSKLPLMMAAADLLVSKPGGLSTSEALASGLPFAIVDPYPLQEEANAIYLLESGAGFWVDPVSVFTYKLKSFFAEPAKAERMRDNARLVAKPKAAIEILKELRGMSS